MKRFFLVFIFCALFTMNAEAKINSTAFNANETLTAGKLFLNQVDTVALYLSTPNIVYVPRLSKDMKLHMSLTFLGKSFDRNENAMKGFVMRHIHTFNKTLMERLEFYAPGMAKEFDPNKDVEFVIKAGADQSTVATWREGVWSWAERGEVPSSKFQVRREKRESQERPTSNVERRTSNNPKKIKKCPALVGSAKPAATPKE